MNPLKSVDAVSCRYFILFVFEIRFANNTCNTQKEIPGLILKTNLKFYISAMNYAKFKLCTFVTLRDFFLSQDFFILLVCFFCAGL